MEHSVYTISNNGLEPLSENKVDLDKAIEAVMVETTRALSQIQAGMDLLASAVLRLASIVALQVSDKGSQS